jgi:hypothetical protein
MVADNTIKYLSVTGPLLASTIAVTYDVGFFFGSDIGFFTFFSFTEHLVFALQAAPFAVSTAGAVLGWLFGSWLGYQQAQERAAKFVEADTDEKQRMLDQNQKTQGRLLKYRPYFILAMIGAAIGSLSNRSYTAALTSVLTALAVGYFPTVEQLIAKPSLRTTTGAAVVLSTLLIAFSFGYDRAQLLLTSTFSHRDNLH